MKEKDRALICLSYGGRKEGTEAQRQKKKVKNLLPSKIPLCGKGRDFKN